MSYGTYVLNRQKIKDYEIERNGQMEDTVGRLLETNEYRN